MTHTTPHNVRDAMNRLHNLDKTRRSANEDPMTAHCGCGADLNAEYDRRERSLAAYILNHSPRNSGRWQSAFDRIEQYMP